MDTNKDTSMIVHLENNKNMKFDEVSSGLYSFKGKKKVMNKKLSVNSHMYLL